MPTLIAPLTRPEVIAEIRETLNDHADYCADSYDLDLIVREAYVKMSGDVYLPLSIYGGGADDLDDVDPHVFWMTVDDALLTSYAGEVAVVGGTLFAEVRGHGGRLVDQVQTEAPGVHPEAETVTDAMRLAGWEVRELQGERATLARLQGSTLPA